MSEGTSGPAWEAAKRAGREHLRTLERKADAAIFAAFRASGLGSNVPSTELAELCSEQFRSAARATASTYQGLKGRTATSRADLLREALTPMVTQTLNVFDKHDGAGTLGHRQNPLEREDLSLTLRRIVDDVCADLAAGVFGLNTGTSNALPDPPPSRLTDHGIKTATLEVFARNSMAHKINVLGRPYQPGPLESQLGIQFTDEERAGAARALEQLIADDLLRPTYSDIADPERWLAITEAGRSALAAGATDELEAALSKLGQHFVDMRNGARAAYLSGRPDGQRQAAFSARELLVQVLHSLAPDDAVRAQAGFGDQKITRKARVRFALRTKTDDYSDSAAEMIESAAGWVESLHDKLSAEAHGRDTARQARHLIQSVDMILETLLL
jgi:hypothetical protein